MSQTQIRTMRALRREARATGAEDLAALAEEGERFLLAVDHAEKAGTPPEAVKALKTLATAACLRLLSQDVGRLRSFDTISPFDVEVDDLSARLAFELGVEWGRAWARAIPGAPFNITVSSVHAERIAKALEARGWSVVPMSGFGDQTDLQAYPAGFDDSDEPVEDLGP